MEAFMKRIVSLILIGILLISAVAIADVITIDPSTASDKEIADAISILQEEEINRAKESIPNKVSRSRGNTVPRSSVVFYQIGD